MKRTVWVSLMIALLLLAGTLPGAVACDMPCCPDCDPGMECTSMPVPPAVPNTVSVPDAVAPLAQAGGEIVADRPEIWFGPARSLSFFFSPLKIFLQLQTLLI